LESPSSRIRPPAPFQKKSIQVPKSKSELGNKPVTKLAFVSTSTNQNRTSESTNQKADSTEKKPHPEPPPLPPTPQEATKNVVKLINAAEKAPPIPAKSTLPSQLPPKHSKINVPNQLPESSTNQKIAGAISQSEDRKIINKPPTPPERTTSSSSMKDIEMTVEDLEIEVPQEKEVPPAEIKVIDVHESSKIEQVEQKSEKSDKKSDEKK